MLPRGLKAEIVADARNLILEHLTTTMSLPNTASAELRLRNLDNRLLVAAVYAGALVLYLYGGLRSVHPYGDPRFVIGYFTTELGVAVFLLLTTALFFPAARLGFRLPSIGNARQLLPLAVLLLTALGAWVAVRASLPAGAPVDNGMSLRVLRTTVMVGLTEEWIFRGLMLAALCRWLGLRRGAIVSLLLFGGFHLMNIALGVPPLAGLFQAFSTMLIGATFLLAALGTRSLLLPMIAHALYDFAVIDVGNLAHAGASGLPMLAILGTGIVAGVYSLIRIARLQGSEPYIS